MRLKLGYGSGAGAPEESEASEADLVARAATDPESFGQLYERHYSTVLNYIYRCTLNVAVAEDLTSNTFFKALGGLRTYRHQRMFRTWLYRIATNEVRMHWRSERKRGHDRSWEEELGRIRFTSADAETPEEIEEKMRRFAAVHEAMGELSHRYQTVLVLRYFEGLRNEEIAEVLDKRPGTVKSLIHRGLKRLRQRLGDTNATF